MEKKTAEISATSFSLEQLNLQAQHTLIGHLGFRYTNVSSGRIEATMPVDEYTCQPFGLLHGGASLALGETLAGVGSMLLCDTDEIAVGIQVSGNHVSSVRKGDTVHAVATLVHHGCSSHVWNVDIFSSADRLVSSIRIVNSVLKKR